MEPNTCGTLLAAVARMHASGAVQGLSSTQLRELRELLERRQGELEETLAALATPRERGKLSELASKLHLEGTVRRRHIASLQRELVALKRNQIRAALWRMNSGQYGPCLRCAGEIPYEQLRIRPEATLCRHCYREDE